MKKYQRKTYIKSTAIVYQSHQNINNSYIIATFKLNSKEQEELNRYIYQREIELVNEFKKLKLY